jgi:sigma-E factor negative regulatory protein RseA
MSDRLRESVSALFDGEGDELELRRLLASEQYGEVRSTWRAYHLQRDSLTGADTRFAHIDISARVQAALVDDAVPARVGAGARWWRPLASVAVAASVAAVVVISTRGFDTAQPGAAVAQTQSPAAGRVYPAQAGPALGNVAVSAQLSDLPASQAPLSLSPDELAQRRLQHYLLRHTERAALNNGQGMISFARVSQLDAE